MTLQNRLIIAVDFDGTIVEDAYPRIGKPRIFAFETLKKLQEDGHRLILWTYRSHQSLIDAVEFCKANGITFYAVNQSYPNEPEEEGRSRKIYADLFIDDRNIGGILGWGEVYQLINKNAPGYGIPEKKKKKGLFSIFK